MQSKLSVVIITYNEEQNIEACIRSVLSIADEVYVLDSFSTDNTVNVAKNMGARVDQHIFNGHIEQKNRAKNNAAYDFVLSLDADETLSHAAISFISQEKEKGFAADGYYFNRINFYCGIAVKTCGWYPDSKLRLWNKKKGNWGGINPHDKFILKESATAVNTKLDLLHNTYPTYDAMKKQVDKFAKISASHLQNKSTLLLILKRFIGSSFKFFRCFILKLGFTQGKIGFQVSFWQCKGVALKYKYALQLKHGKQI